MRKLNFGAGPSVLPESILRQAQDELLSYENKGFSIMEISHRSAIFEELLNNAKKDALELYGFDSNDWEVIFTQGGASLNFCMVAMNFSQDNKPCEYINTDVWTKKAYKEAQILGLNPVYVASSEEDNFSYIPKAEFSDNASYAYICSNNTIQGTQYHEYPDSKAPLIIDASSDFFSRKMDFKNAGFIFGGLQKNAGISGLACCFIRKDMIELSRSKNIPSMLKYSVYVDNNSMFNTPPTFALYIFAKQMQWLKDMGGLDNINKKNIQKAELLYSTIENISFYTLHAKKEDRSLMNVSFKTPTSELDKLFVSESEKAGMIGLKGHKLLGGIRASIYNAQNFKNVETLAEFIKDFANKHA